MKKIISLYGRAAAGKTTQANLLHEKYGFYQFGMGERLRAEIESGSELGEKMRPYVEAGTLIPNELMEKTLGNVFVETKDGAIPLNFFKPGDLFCVFESMNFLTEHQSSPA